MKPADHPRTCRTCHGDGWQPGPDRWGHAHGQPIRYTTVEPCTHHWTDDPPDPPHYDELLDGSNPRAIAAFAAGYAQGQAELYEESGGRLGTPLRLLDEAHYPHTA